MLLTISTTHQPTTDFGYLLHKHPDKVQTFDISAGKAHVFYPELTDNRCTACLLLEIDPISLVRNMKGPAGGGFMLQNYVNDRPYVCSSFMSNAIAVVLGSALNGRCKDKPDLVEQNIPLEATLSVAKIKGGERLIETLFTPLGYEYTLQRHLLDEEFTSWGESPYYTLTLRNTTTLRALLSHLYVFLPIFDNEKHYWVDRHEVEKLMEKGEGWLSSHPAKEFITRRYLKNIGELTKIALVRLTEEEQNEEIPAEDTLTEEQVKDVEQRVSLHQKRLDAALEQVKLAGAKTVLDLGCGEGKLLKMLMRENQIEKILGIDVSYRSLEIAKEKLRFETMNEYQRNKIEIVQGSVTYRDKRLEGYDAACIVEVIEHLDLPRLTSFERVIFEFAHPKTVIITTPNAEYNIKYESLTAGIFRHDDHRFEWTREEFQSWATQVCEKYGYTVELFPVGDVDEQIGSPSQMGVFKMNTNQ